MVVLHSIIISIYRYIYRNRYVSNLHRWIDHSDTRPFYPDDDPACGRRIYPDDGSLEEKPPLNPNGHHEGYCLYFPYRRAIYIYIYTLWRRYPTMIRALVHPHTPTTHLSGCHVSIRIHGPCVARVEILELEPHPSSLDLIYHVSIYHPHLLISSSHSCRRPRIGCQP
jgi:hypothetical protein